MIDRYLWAAGNSVDVLVVCFFGQRLADSNLTQVGRLAHWFAVPGEIGPPVRGLPQDFRRSCGFPPFFRVDGFRRAL